MRVNRLAAGALACALGVMAPHAFAQQSAPPPGPPPPGYGAPPPGYPPPGYQPGYPGYPPPMYGPYYGQQQSRGPAHLPYKEGDPIPPGYTLEEKMRTGLVIGGSVLIGIPYVMGLTFASANDFSNESGWLILPVLGPWVMLSRRNSTCDEPGVEEAVGCVGDVWLGMLLVMDGLMQAGGAIMLTFGLTTTKTRLVREDLVTSLTLRPARIGSGHGLRLSGAF